MLRHLENTPPKPAVTVEGSANTETRTVSPPFTAEEIARAIAELEKERLLRDSAQTGTAQIADILEQLHLDLPASDVSAQIERERTARSQATRGKRQRRTLFAGFGSALACLGAGMFLLSRAHRPAAVIAPPMQVAEAATPVQTPKVVPLSQVIITDTSSGEPVKKTLAEVPEGKLVTIGSRQLLSMLTVLDSSPDNYGENIQWTIFRKGTRCYVRAFTETRLSPGALKAEPIVKIVNTKPKMMMSAPVPVTVPLDAFLVDWTSTFGQEPNYYHVIDARLTRAGEMVFGSGAGR